MKNKQPWRWAWRPRTCLASKIPLRESHDLITCGPPFLKGTSVSAQDGVICTTCPASEKALSAGVRKKQPPGADCCGVFQPWDGREGCPKGRGGAGITISAWPLN